MTTPAKRMARIIFAVALLTASFSVGRLTAPEVCQTPDRHMPDGVWFGLKGATNRPARAHVIARLGGTNNIVPVEFSGAAGTWHDVRIEIDAANFMSVVQVTPIP